MLVWNFFYLISGNNCTMDHATNKPMVHPVKIRKKAMAEEEM
jgi:hypothetical protein